MRLDGTFRSCRWRCGIRPTSASTRSSGPPAARSTCSPRRRRRGDRLALPERPVRRRQDAPAARRLRARARGAASAGRTCRWRASPGAWAMRSRRWKAWTWWRSTTSMRSRRAQRRDRAVRLPQPCARRRCARRVCRMRPAGCDRPVAAGPALAAGSMHRHRTAAADDDARREVLRSARSAAVWRSMTRRSTGCCVASAATSAVLRSCSTALTRGARRAAALTVPFLREVLGADR